MDIYKVNPRASDRHGWSGCWQMVDVLYDTGAIDVQHRNHAGMTAQMYAAQSSGGEDLARLLVTDCGIDVHAYHINGWTCLFYAAAEGSAQILELLIREYGCRRCFDPIPCPKIASMPATNVDVVAVLDPDLYGANVNEVNREGMTCSVLAAEDMATFLVELSADIGVEDYDVLSALDHATECGHHDALALLESSIEKEYGDFEEKL